MFKIATYIIFILGCNFFFAQKIDKDSVFTFFFKPAKYTVSSESISSFQTFFKKFENCAFCTYELRGFADSVGNDRQNKILSENRVNFVIKQLKTVKADRIKSFSFGEEYSQNTSKSQDYRKVVLKVKNSTDNKSQISSPEPSKLSLKEKRFLQFVKRNSAVRLNILFHLNSTETLEESEEDIQLLSEYLKLNPTVNAKLLGHVCCNNNYQLSRSRALQIKVTLVKSGVHHSRISAEGFGNTKPEVPEINAEAEQTNRRVEVIFWELGKKL